ncbi:hypothetical protein ACQV5M_20355 [Leptospira sp. SA-E8]|uniref:hypothetical protein n=1 Tax=Leptospira sp. SA-E8 TaxID=3422259 RepID=UPI003EBB892C
MSMPGSARYRWAGAGALAVSALLLAACASPVGSPEAEVRLATPEQVAGCRNLGTTVVSVPAAVGPVARLPEAVEENLLVEARRQARRMTGDTLVKGESFVFGQRGFGVYRCAP